MIYSSEELIEKCKEAITAHVKAGGKILYGGWGFISPDDWKLQDNCGCPLTILCLDKLLQSYKISNEYSVCMILAKVALDYANTQDQINQFVMGFDHGGYDPGRKDTYLDYYVAGRNIRLWVEENYSNKLIKSD